MIRPRRSLLFMPGSNARALEKARNLPVDGIILDLKDSVAPDAKAVARDQIARAIAAGGFGKREVLIRVNSLDTPWWVDDVTMAGKARPDGILVPKVSTVADLNAIANRLSDINADVSIGSGPCSKPRAGCRMPTNWPRQRRIRKPGSRASCSGRTTFAGDADPHAAGPRGDDPDDHALHPGDAHTHGL